MTGCLAFLMLKVGGQMNRRLFPSEDEARAWIASQPVPPYAYCWGVERFDDKGYVESSQHLNPGYD